MSSNVPLFFLKDSRYSSLTSGSVGRLLYISYPAGRVDHIKHLVLDIMTNLEESL